MVYFARWKVITVLAIVALGFLFASLNLLNKRTAEGLPSFLPHKQVNLGLDLQGGSHLLLQVGVNAVVRERLNAMVDAVRIALRQKRIRYTGLGARGNGVSVGIRSASQLSQAQSVLTNVEQGTDISIDGNRISITLGKEALAEIRRSAVEQSIEIVRRRIDETGTKEPTIQRQGNDRILLQLPGVDDPERVKRLLGRTAKMTFHLLDQSGASLRDAIQAGVPLGSRLLPGLDGGGQKTGSAVYSQNEPRQYLVQKRVAVGGDRLIDAQPSFDQRTNEPVVTFRFDTVGGKRFADVTRANVNRPFAVVLDGKVVTAPVIREPILGGSGQISGNFTTQEAQDMALLLRAGALPAPLTILEERTVGPGLGADSIAAGKVASVIGLVLVVVFMVIIYGLFGFFADVALFVNMVMILWHSPLCKLRLHFGELPELCLRLAWPWMPTYWCLNGSGRNCAADERRFPPLMRDIHEPLQRSLTQISRP